MICFPLDNTPYEAKDMGTYLATRTRGVFSSDGNLAVTPGESGLSVSVSPGLAWLKWSDYWGTAALQEQALTLALDTADGALKRIDAIVCRLDKVNNRAEIVVKKGAPSSAPIVVPPVRDANYDELYIATVLIGAGVISISASAITDQRLNEEYCGLMRDGVTGIPTASLHAQAQQILTELTDALNAQIVRQSSEFDAWFEELKGKLGEDPATALQQQVDNLNAAVVGDAFQASGTPVSIAYAGTNRIASITAYGENAQGGTTEAPVALTGVDSVQVCGKNMLPNKAKTNTVAGITYTVNPDKSVTAKGTATSWSNIVIDADFSLPAGTYTLNSNIQTAGVSLVIGKDTSGKKNIAVSATASKTFTLSDSIKHCVAYIAVAPDSVVDTTIRPMLNLGKTAMPYEPYKGNVTQLPIPRPLRKVGDVRDVCRTRVKSVYDKRIVLDGTENWNISSSKPNSFLTPVSERIVNGLSDSYPTLKSPEIGTKNGIYLNYTADIIVTDLACSTVEEFKAHLSAHPLTVYYRSTAYDGTNGLDVCLTEYQTGYIESYADESITTAWISSTGELSTGAEVAYVLSSPETYATEPLDFDNAAGPLTVMTGGEVEVRMTELIGSRTYDADGDGVVDRAAAVPWDGVTGKPDTFTPSTHNHDDRYYTESEIDTKLNGKANSSHTHGVGDISGVLPSTKGGTGANKSVLAISSAIVTTESQGYANVNISTNATICAVVSQGSATGQCYSISVIDPKTGGVSIQVKNYQGNPVANTTLRVNYIAYSI